MFPKTTSRISFRKVKTHIKKKKSMNYILDYLSNLTDNKNPNLVFSSFHNVQVQDPLSKLIKWLNTDRGTGIRIKSEEDI